MDILVDGYLCPWDILVGTKYPDGSASPPVRLTSDDRFAALGLVWKPLWEDVVAIGESNLFYSLINFNRLVLFGCQFSSWRASFLEGVVLVWFSCIGSFGCLVRYTS